MPRKKSSKGLLNSKTLKRMQDRVEALWEDIREYYREPEELRDRVKKHVEDLRKDLKSLRNEFQEQTEGVRERIEEIRSRVLGAIGITTQSDLKEVMQRLEKLEKKMAGGKKRGRKKKQERETE